MRQWSIKTLFALLLTSSGLAHAQIDAEHFFAANDQPQYLPALPFDGATSTPFSLSIEQRSYSHGNQGLQSQREYLAQERMRLRKGEGNWMPPTYPLARPNDDKESDNFYDQTLFQLMYRFDFN